MNRGMQIRKTRNERVGQDQFVVSDDSDWSLFNTIATSLETHLQGSWTAQLDGLDQRYWDLRVGDAIITLHLEHYLGIMLFVAQQAPDQAASETLLESAIDYLSSFEPA